MKNFKQRYVAWMQEEHPSKKRLQIEKQEALKHIKMTYDMLRKCKQKIIFPPLSRVFKYGLVSLKFINGHFVVYRKYKLNPNDRSFIKRYDIYYIEEY